MRLTVLSRCPATCALHALVALGAIAIAGCASEPVSIEAAPVRAAAQIDRPVAFLHSPEFRNQQVTLEPYGNKYYLPLKIGESSDKALRATYAQLFATATEVSSRDEVANAGAAAPTALIEPSIVGFKYLNASHRMEGPSYAEVDYRFRLSDGQGQALAVWTVRGIGRYPSDAARPPRTKDSPPAPRGEQGIIVEAPRRAVEDAMSGFVHDFERVPELIRWTRGEPLAGVDAPPAALSTKGVLSASSAADASVAGAFTLRVERAPLPRPAKQAAEEGAPETSLIALRIGLGNDGEHRLALDPSDVQWIVDGRAPMEPIPAAAVAALVTRLPFGLAVAPGVGVGALPALVAALISAGEMARHQSEFAAWSAALTSESLTDGVAGPRASRSGLVYFPKPGSAAGTLVVQVIDLDAAVRYTVRIPTEGG
jgi:hypothetical protein